MEGEQKIKVVVARSQEQGASSREEVKKVLKMSQELGVTRKEVSPKVTEKSQEDKPINKERSVLPFGIEAILSPSFALRTKIDETSQNVDIKQEDEEELPFILPFGNPFFTSCFSSEEEKRSGSTSPLRQDEEDMRRRRPVLPFLLPHNLSLRKHR